jgi:phosphatidylglycerophosphate synthase
VWLRQVLALQDAGIVEVCLLGAPELPRDARVTLRLSRESLSPEGPALFLRADTLFHPALLGDLLGLSPDAPEVFGVSSPGAALVVAGNERGAQILREGAAALTPARWSLAKPGEKRFLLRADAPEAERALLDSLRKGVDGVIARNLNRHVSLWLTARLSRTSLTPNHVTLIAALFGVAAIVLFAQGGYSSVFWGGAALQLQSIIDGCDGELARLRYQRSRGGEWLDNLCDDAINLGVLLAVGYGLGGFWWSLAGTAGAALLFYDFTLYYALLTADPPTGNPFLFRWWFQAEAMGPYVAPGGSVWRRGVGALSGALQAAGRRDFYLFLFFAAGALGVVQIALAWHAFGSLVAGGTALLQWLLAGPPRAARSVREA